MWFAFALALAFESVDASHVLPFDPSDEGAIVIPVWLDGQGPFRFLLDTGSSQSVVSEGLARRLGLKSASQTMMVLPSGDRVPRPVARLNSLAIATHRVADVTVAIAPSDLLASARRVDGIIGQDVLARVVYTIDYRRSVIVWHIDGRAPAGAKLPLEVHGGRLLVAIREEAADGIILRLIPDTGTDALVLFARANRRLPAMTPLDVGLLRSLSGQRLVRRVLLDQLNAGDLQLQNVLAVLVPRSDAEALDGDGLLPLHIFSSVTFNVSEGFLVLRR